MQDGFTKPIRGRDALIGFGESILPVNHMPGSVLDISFSLYNSQIVSTAALSVQRPLSDRSVVVCSRITINNNMYVLFSDISISILIRLSAFFLKSLFPQIRVGIQSD